MAIGSKGGTIWAKWKELNKRSGFGDRRPERPALHQCGSSGKERDSARGLRLQPRSWPRRPALSLQRLWVAIGIRPAVPAIKPALLATGLSVSPDQAPPGPGCSQSRRRTKHTQGSSPTKSYLGDWWQLENKQHPGGAGRRGLIMAAGSPRLGSPSLDPAPIRPAHFRVPPPALLLRGPAPDAAPPPRLHAA